MHLHQLKLKYLDFWISLPIICDNLDALGHFNCNAFLVSAYFKLVSFNYEMNKTILVPNILKKNCSPLVKIK